jgi:DNA-binding SARP family transcriptional activator/general stress protein YciG
MRFAVLGSVLAADDAGPIELPGSMPRIVLTVLLLRANTVVSADRLIDAVWKGRPPASATASLYNHVMRLRRQLGDPGGDRVRAVAPGYTIRVEPGELDLDVFAALCTSGRAARRQENWVKASEDFASALSLWADSPETGLAELAGRESQAVQLLEERWQAWEGRIEADLRLGRHEEAIGYLRALTADHPLREAFHGQLMLALYRAHRQTEALDAFQRLRRTLVEELGVEPSPSVRELHRLVLTADPRLASPAPLPAVTPIAPTGPAVRLPGVRSQLPADTRVFNGRAHELEQLLRLADTASEPDAVGTVVISAIDGMGGVGKSALAVHAAHRLRDRFPDRQLFIDLHGHTPGLEPLTASEALSRLLCALGVPPHLIPRDVNERASYYRDRLSGTRTLIVLDNASGTAQVRPLIPGTSGCLVLVTSRRRLTGLDDAYSVALDVLPDSDAAALLHQVAGRDRLPDNHPGVVELLALCGYLPLAVRIVASRLRHHRALRIEDLVAMLRDENARLGHLQDEDRSLTAVFDLSFRQLPEAEQRMFRSLGLIPGPDFDAYAAAALADVDPRAAERSLESLLDHNLLLERDFGRYRFHDLVRLYARTLSADEPGAEHQAARDLAVDRLLHYYAHTAQNASRAVTRFSRPEPAGPPPAHAPDLPDADAAQAWLRAEQPNLDAAFTHARTHRLDERAIALAAGLAEILHTDGPKARALEVHRAAAEAAERLGRSAAHANALTDLGRVRRMTGDRPGADDALSRALEIYRAIGDRGGEADTLTDLGRARTMSADHSGAGEALAQALEIYRETGDLLGQATVLTGLGRVWHQTGDRPGAGGAFAQALDAYRVLGHRSGEANSLICLGVFRQHDGDHPGATADLTRALEIYRELGHRDGEATALINLGRLRQLTGDVPGGVDATARALEIYRETGNRSGEANAAADLGQARYQAEDLPGAVEALAEALDIYRELGECGNQAWALNHYAAALAATGDRPRALTLYQQALAMNQELNKPDDEAVSLEGIAEHHLATGDTAQGTAYLRRSLEIYQRLDLEANAQRARHRLAEFDA